MQAKQPRNRQLSVQKCNNYLGNKVCKKQQSIRKISTKEIRKEVCKMVRKKGSKELGKKVRKKVARNYRGKCA